MYINNARLGFCEVIGIVYTFSSSGYNFHNYLSEMLQRIFRAIITGLDKRLFPFVECIVQTLG